MSTEAIQAKYSAVSLEGSDMREHMPTLKKYASECSSIVEFGVYDCTSTWGLLAGNPKWMRSYDVIRRIEVDEVERITKACGVDFKFVLGNSLLVDIEQTDLLFIDTYHMYAQLREELAKHHSKANKFILMHDTTTFGCCGEDGKAPGLWDATCEFLKKHSSVWKLKERFHNCHGLTVLERIT